LGHLKEQIVSATLGALVQECGVITCAPTRRAGQFSSPGALTETIYSKIWINVFSL